MCVKGGPASHHEHHLCTRRQYRCRRAQSPRPEMLVTVTMIWTGLPTLMKSLSARISIANGPPAHADRKTKLQEKINQLDTKTQAQLQRAKEKLMLRNVKRRQRYRHSRQRRIRQYRCLSGRPKWPPV